MKFLVRFLFLFLVFIQNSDGRIQFNSLSTLPVNNGCPPCDLEFMPGRTKITHPLGVNGEILELSLLATTQSGLNVRMRLNEQSNYTILNREIQAVRAVLFARVMTPFGLKTMRFDIQKSNILSRYN